MGREHGNAMEVSLNNWEEHFFPEKPAAPEPTAEAQWHAPTLPSQHQEAWSMESYCDYILTAEGYQYAIVPKTL